MSPSSQRPEPLFASCDEKATSLEVLEAHLEHISKHNPQLNAIVTLNAEEASFKPLADYVPRQDATVVERLKAAGAVIIGKTNMPMLALDIQTNSPLFGTANISQLERFLSGWDAWLCPVTAGPAFPHCKMGQPIVIDEQPMSYFTASVGFTSVFNLTGNPVVVIPMGKSEEGLPLGMQIVGRRWTDMRLLSIAQAVSKAVMPFSRPTGY
ncbi:MAG: hypothetical protein HOK67_03940 [Deltaproteobacteria bacterium]|nr:hypothetical protein [Deltaproteobacteria bacterium]